MTAEESRRLAQQFLDAFNEGDWDRCRQLVSPDVVLEERTVDGRTDTADGLVERLQAFRSAAPGLRVDVDSWVTADDGSAVAGEVTWTRDDQEGAGAVPGMVFFTVDADRLRTVHELHAPLHERLNCEICMHPPSGPPHEPPHEP